MRGKKKNIIEYIHHTSKYFPKTRIELSNFAYFDHGTIFINIKRNNSAIYGVSVLRSILKDKLKNNANLKATFISKLHLTIAKNISKENFDLAWKDYQHKLFQASFYADKMILLKREIDLINHNPTSSYKQIETFNLLDDDQSANQLQLF